MIHSSAQAHAAMLAITGNASLTWVKPSVDYLAKRAPSLLHPLEETLIQASSSLQGLYPQLLAPPFFLDKPGFVK